MIKKSTYLSSPSDDRLRIARALALQGDGGALADHEVAVRGIGSHRGGNWKRKSIRWKKLCWQLPTLSKQKWNLDLRIWIGITSSTYRH